VAEYANGQGWAEQAGIPIDIYSIQTVLRAHIQRSDMTLIVSDKDGVVGFLAGILVPWPLDIRNTEAHEELVVGQNQDEMREVFDQWAHDRGSHAVVMCCLQQDSGRRIRRIV
jgi:hypothetical protein